MLLVRGAVGCYHRLFHDLVGDGAAHLAPQQGIIQRCARGGGCSCPPASCAGAVSGIREQPQLHCCLLDQGCCIGVQLISPSLKIKARQAGTGHEQRPHTVHLASNRSELQRGEAFLVDCSEKS